VFPHVVVDVDRDAGRNDLVDAVEQFRGESGPVDGEVSVGVLLGPRADDRGGDRGVASELLKHSEGDNPFFSDNRSRVLAAGRPLLLAAQETHEIRGDLAIDQVLDMIAAVAHIYRSQDYLEPILQTVLDGLLPPRTGPTAQTPTA
jgi:hypothetical protein